MSHLLDDIYYIYFYSVVCIWWVTGIDVPRFLFGWLAPDVSGLEEMLREL